VVWIALAAGCGVGDLQTSQVEQHVSQCGSAVVEGLDVYDGQGKIDWTEVKADGRDFAFIKATQGDYDVQTTFGSNWTNAGSAGVLRSAYHFFDPGIDGSAQAQWFLAALGSAGGMTNADLPPMLDIECPVSASSTTAQSEDANCEYTGSDGWVATATMTQRIYDWIAAVTAATGRTPIVYSYPSWFGDVDFTDAQLADLPLFIASYTTCANVPAPWGSAVFWQYSATGTVTGVTGKLDVDRFFGSADDLAAWNAGTLPVDAGVPAPDAGGGPDGGIADQADAGTVAPKPAGCGCDASAPGLGGSALALYVAAALVQRRRRRR
jgi:lysozyme